FLGRDVGVANDTVVRGGGAADPQMIVRKSDGEIGLRTTKAQRRKSSLVEELRAPAKHRVVPSPIGDRIRAIDPRGRKDRVPQLTDGILFRMLREHRLCPG